MEKNDYVMFAQTYNQVKAICKEIMNKLSCEEGGVVNECIVNSEYPEFESLYINKDGDVEFVWNEEEYGEHHHIDKTHRYDSLVFYGYDVR